MLKNCTGSQLRWSCPRPSTGGWVGIKKMLEILSTSAAKMEDGIAQTGTLRQLISTTGANRAVRVNVAVTDVSSAQALNSSTDAYALTTYRFTNKTRILRPHPDRRFVKKCVDESSFLSSSPLSCACCNFCRDCYLQQPRSHLECPRVLLLYSLER